MTSPTKEYLGDSVYAELESGIVKLTTENGFRASNMILLEPQVYQALKEWAQRVGFDPPPVRFIVPEPKRVDFPAPQVFEVGQRVHYIAHEGAAPENGIVKSLPPDRPSCVFVVYKCNGDWDNYQNYTGCSTIISDLEDGWV